MATIHSLPPELIAHILALAYDTSTSFTPPDPYTHRAAYAHAKAGLRAAALVHSAWRAPAQELLTAELHFGTREPGALERFLARVPAGYQCGRLELAGLKVDEARRVLGHARAGGVRGIWLFGKAPLDVFGMVALSDLRHLKLGDVRPKLDPLPTTLQSLELVCPDTFPSWLIAASASTLATLDLILRHPSHIPVLAELAPSLSALRHLSLDCSAPELAVSDYAADLAQLVSHLPNLLSLRLPPLWPALLERVLRALPPQVRLRRLQVEVIAAEEADDVSARLEGAGGWLAGLERCAKVPALARVEKWDVGVGWRTAEAEPVWWTLDRRALGRFHEGQAGQRERWAAFEWNMRERGMELSYAWPGEEEEKEEVEVET